MVVISAVGYALAPADYTWTFEASRFIPVAVVTLLLIPLQAGGEEVLFRGYLMQWTTLGFDRRSLSPRTRLIVLAAISGVLFGIPHVINPEAEGAEWYAWLAWFFLGAGWAWVAIVDGRIELAIGAHIANNLMGVLVIGYSNSVLPVESLWTTPVLNLPATIVSSAIAAALFIVITCRGLRPRWGTN